MQHITSQSPALEMGATSFEEIIADEWNALFDMTPAPVMKNVTKIALNHMHELLDKYRSYLSSEASLKAFLHSDEMRDKWINLFESWVRQLFDMKFTDANHFIDVQNDIGQKLSRIGYPPHAVTKALRLIKSWVLNHIFHQPWNTQEKMQSVLYVTNLIGLSFEVRNHGYMKGISDQSRLDTTFRLSSISNNIGVERERQRAFLSEWEKKIFFWLYHPTHSHLPRLSKSEFGIWFTHKACLMFEQSPSLVEVGTSIKTIDEDILPKLAPTLLEDRKSTLLQIELIEQQLAKIRFILHQAFDTHMEFENARDVLTQLLNRRFMHTVLSREINLQRRPDTLGFGLLLLDLDHFKQINDTHGHTVGDIVLKKAAAVITNSIRPSDFAFRYGGEEVLIALVEVDPAMTAEVAEKIRKHVEQHQFPLPDGQKLSLTTSIGCAHAKGKYDYQTVINEADKALYQAKHLGRNQIYMSKT